MIGAASKPASIPLFPLQTVLFPGGPLPLRIFETRYVDMVRDCMRDSSGFGVVLIRSGNEVGPVETYDIGTAASIVDFHQLSDGFLGLSCRGGTRFRISGRSAKSNGLNIGAVEWLESEPSIEVPPHYAPLRQLLESALAHFENIYGDMEVRLDDAAWVGYRLAEILPIPAAQKQFCLELRDPLERLEFLNPIATD